MYKETTQFHRQRTKPTRYSTIDLTMIYYDAPTRRDCFLVVFDGMFLSVSNRFWFCSTQEIVISRPPGPRAFGLASACTSWAPAAVPMP